MSDLDPSPGISPTQNESFLARFRHVLNYFWTILTDGKGHSHYGDGHISEVQYRAGDTKHLAHGLGESMIHDLENIGDTTLLFTTVEFLKSGIPPLPIE